MTDRPPTIVKIIQGVHQMNADNTSPEIRINPQFNRLVQPPSEREIERMHQDNIHSSHEPIIHVWNNFHLTDQYLHMVCLKYNIPFSIKEVPFDDRIKAALYICSIQLAKDNLSAEYRKYLIGQKYQYTIMKSEDNKQSDSKYRIAAVMGHDFYISAGTVMKYSSFSSAVNEIFEQDTEFAQRLLLGKTRISHENILELSRLRPNEIKAIATSVMEENLDHITLSYIRNEVKWSYIHKQAPVSRKERKEQKMVRHAAIRQMPEYDPDAEVNSLCMTIDSWISSIQRVHNSENFNKITNKASLQLMKKLSFLEHTVNSIQESLVERNNL